MAQSYNVIEEKQKLIEQRLTAMKNEIDLIREKPVAYNEQRHNAMKNELALIKQQLIANQQELDANQQQLDAMVAMVAIQQQQNGTITNPTPAAGWLVISHLYFVYILHPGPRRGFRFRQYF